MLDFDLAELYEVQTRVLDQAVKRNIERFPEDFKTQFDMTDKPAGLYFLRVKYDNISKEIYKLVKLR